ncbi:DUF983 domain-containing protein [Lutimonas halocynthiae]|uniref:DUF983 domain-containing protein n=1 Tax=Lutimonas halocynthiae TaxID=1446477 RepID=UPI0025B48CAE|nr:DUF983 domain-containing protein [Lutimonas halocynthiae]MDN3642429.1 DUF983 domain-containing protein [Lutimonas halocynthiae]
MLKKGSKLYSVFNNKCPQCQEGKFFKHACTLNFKKNLSTHKTCESCGLRYMIEPSFFYGAMYVSYAITVALAVAIFIIGYFLGLGLIGSFAAIVLILLSLTPLTMRISRLLYINMFVHYKKETS